MELKTSRPTTLLGPPPVDFGAFVRSAAAGGRLVVQPRMGFSDPRLMRAGLVATKAADAVTVGTITIDSYTRVADLATAADSMRDGIALNGYPLATHPRQITEAMLAGVRDNRFPVQVRHGSAVPEHIFAAMAAVGLNATEGGPVSYCLPYGRTPLAASVRNWRESVSRFSGLADWGADPHLETFGGCMLGQLCPPGMLVAISVLEALFFCRLGIRSVSVSYAQQTNAAQDVEAVTALRRLCRELLPTPNWHVVLYAYMGLYPETVAGSQKLLTAAAELATSTGCERLIVKTVAESRRIPTVEENVAALELAAWAARNTLARNILARNTVEPGSGMDTEPDSELYLEARALIEAVLELGGDVGLALIEAFARGYLDIPYCLHPDNAARTRSYIAPDGRLCWADTGSLPLPGVSVRGVVPRRVTSAGLLADLSYVRDTFDGLRSPAAASGIEGGTGGLSPLSS